MGRYDEPLPELGDTICGDLRLESLAPVSVGAKALRPVYVARMLDTGETIWLTIVDPAYTPTSMDISRFMAGASELLQLRHPSLARVVRVDREADSCVVGYEALPGAEPLGASVTRPDARRHLTRTALEVARGLAFLHRSRVLHGALGPSTVLLWEGVPLLWHHGIASLCVSDVLGPKAALRGDVVAPEIERGDPLGTRADVYAWGAVVAMLAAGTVGPEALERVRRGKIGSSVHAGLLGLVERALDPSASVRPHDGIELLDALRRTLEPDADREGGEAPPWVPVDAGGEAALRRLASRYLDEIAEQTGTPGRAAPARVDGDDTPRDGTPVAAGSGPYELLDLTDEPPPPPPAVPRGARPSQRGKRGKALTPLPPLPELPSRAPEGEPVLDRVLEELGGPRPEDALDLTAYEAPLPPRRISEDEPPPPPMPEKRRIASGPSREVPAFVPPRLPGPHGPAPRVMAIALVISCAAIAGLATLATRERASSLWADLGTGLRDLAPEPQTHPSPRSTAAHDGGSDAKPPSDPAGGALVKAGDCPEHTARLPTPPEEALSNVCIEHAEHPGWMEMPTTGVSFVEAQRLCAERGRRLCSRAEWRRACMGVEKRALPYGLAPVRGRCRTDADPALDPEAKAGQSGGRSRCVTPEGVFDLVGNVAEWVAEGTALGGTFSAASPTCTTELKPPKSAGRPDVGLRCCVDVEG